MMTECGPERRSLTRRQHEILELVVAGQPNKLIAAKLGVSQRTVENHRATMMKKVGTNSVAGLVRAALRMQHQTPPHDNNSSGRGLTWEVSPELMGELDTRGNLLAVNPAWESVLGWRATELLGLSVFELIHPNDLERSRAGFALIKAGAKPSYFTNRYRHLNGEFLWISWITVMEDGVVRGIGRDITSDRMRAAELKRMHQALQTGAPA